MKRRWSILAAALLPLVACNRTPQDSPDQTVRKPSEVQVIKRATEAMGTFFDCTVALTGGEREDAEAAIGAAFKEIARVEALMTTWDPESPLSKVNAASGGPGVAVPEELLTIIERSKRVSAQTGGKFDISFGAIGRLWDFKAKSPKPPAPAALAAALPLVDYRSVIVDRDKGTVRLAKPGMRIGLGAIAKGYAVDRASAILRSKGFDDFIVYGGGDLYISGKKGDRPWKMGIQNPRDRGAYFAKFSLEKDGAVVTSGDYEKFFELEGRRYHHIIDPATGYPAKGTASVTVVAESTALADALATGIFVLGPEKGMALIEATPSLQGVIVDESLDIAVSSGLRGRIEVKPLKGDR